MATKFRCSPPRDPTSSTAASREDSSDLSESCSLTDGTDSSTGHKRGPRLSLVPISETSGPDISVKIICVGLMRTGLTTLHRALRSIGYANVYDQEDVVHTYDLWDQVLRGSVADNDKAFRRIFEGSEVIMGLPTFCFWEQIAELYPHAKIILTVRDEGEWWESVNTARKMMQRDAPGAPLRYGCTMRGIERLLMPSYHKFCDVLRFAWASSLGAHALDGQELHECVVRSSYRRHNSHVLSVLGPSSCGPSSRLLVYNVREGWEPLCKFLGKDLPEIDFPSVLQVPYFPDQQRVNSGCRAIAQPFEDMLLPESDFGRQMRSELRRGLLVSLVALTVFAVVVVALLRNNIPAWLVGIVYSVIVVIGLQVYAFVSMTVVKVPALVVLPMTLRFVFVAGALHACLITYGVLKEMLVTRDMVASPVLLLSSRIVSVVCAAGYLFATEGKISFGAPLRDMMAFAVTNEASTWAGYEMLKYVSFPVQVMAKSVKLLPTMLMGRCLRGIRYGFGQYFQACLALTCVGVLHWSSSSESSVSAEGACWSLVPTWAGLSGGFLLLLFFACDSFTSQWQNVLYKAHPKLTQVEMMLGGNFLGLLMTSASVVATWHSFFQSAASVWDKPQVLCRIAFLGIAYALSQFCIYSAIRSLGPVSFAWIMTARQLLSVLVSLTFFGHGLSALKVGCIATVLGIMSAKQIARVFPQLGRAISSVRSVKLPSPCASCLGRRETLRIRCRKAL